MEPVPAAATADPDTVAALARMRIAAGTAREAPILLSFDIDGTLEDGEPPGPLTMELARQVSALGYVLGSSSDRTLAEQEKLWGNRGITVDFISHKHHLHIVGQHFSTVGRKIHIGDTDNDAYYARLAGFEFFHVTEVPASGTPGWII